MVMMTVLANIAAIPPVTVAKISQYVEIAFQISSPGKLRYIACLNEVAHPMIRTRIIIPTIARKKTSKGEKLKPSNIPAILDHKRGWF
jgi:hypothetical protein